MVIIKRVGDLSIHLEEHIREVATFNSILMYGVLWAIVYIGFVSFAAYNNSDLDGAFWWTTPISGILGFWMMILNELWFHIFFVEQKYYRVVAPEGIADIDIIATSNIDADTIAIYKAAQTVEDVIKRKQVNEAALLEIAKKCK